MFPGYIYIPNGRFMNDSREHILQTSLKLFLQKNFKEVTMKEIVDKTGFSKGAFYHYFSSKEQVFAEVIRHFFQETMTLDHSKLPQDSLKEFYTAILNKTEQDKTTIEQSVSADTQSPFNNNFYYLIFDAMRLLPDFKAQQLASQKAELSAWKKIIKTARKNKEIDSRMTDEQLAKLFIYLGDGVTINFIIGAFQKRKNELRPLWNALYDSLKA